MVKFSRLTLSRQVSGIEECNTIAAFNKGGEAQYHLR